MRRECGESRLSTTALSSFENRRNSVRIEFSPSRLSGAMAFENSFDVAFKKNLFDVAFKGNRICSMLPFDVAFSTWQHRYRVHIECRD